MTEEWTFEMYTDARGHCSINGWFDGLSVAKFAASVYRLQRNGLAGTTWLKPLKHGLYEFRVRSTAAEPVTLAGRGDA